MGNRDESKRSLTVTALVTGIALCLSVAAFTTRPHVAHAASTPKTNPICDQLGKSIQGSQGAHMFCFGRQSAANSPAPPAASRKPFGSNADAANPKEDVSPSGVQAYGQSETSIASAGPYVVEAWNDATAFFSPCPSPMNKQEATGFGFSSDGGKTFTDLGGLPNSDCANSKLEGDPSVEAYTRGASTYFYISSIFIPFNVAENALSVTACKVNGSGSTATLACGQPIVAATSSDCRSFCSFLDKEFLSIDALRGRLYMAYTEFGPSTGFSGVIELAVCDLSSPGTPTCHNGSEGSITGTGAPPYLVVAPGDPNSCENEGAYPAVDPNTGSVYVAYEHNWATSLNVSNCGREPIQNIMNYIPASCLSLTATSSCAGPAATRAVNITSLEAAFIPGYNRLPMNDFPRVAVSDPAGTASMIWNDAREHGTGDIFLQSFDLGTLTAVQSQPVRINAPNDVGGWHFLPALRNADPNGNLAVSFYSRQSANTALTTVSAALRVNPRTSTPMRRDIKVATGPTDWNAVSSDIVPNFGDYTDNYFDGATLYVAWSDGRLGFPQPFEDRLSVR